MIRYMHCVKRKENISIEDFRQFWNSKLLNNKLTELKQKLQPIKIRKSLTLQVSLNDFFQEERGSLDAFDAIYEVYFESGQKVMDIFNNEEKVSFYK